MKPYLFILLCIALISCANPQQQEKKDSTVNKENSNETLKKWYDGFDAGIHSVYVGEVVGAWKR